MDKGGLGVSESDGPAASAGDEGDAVRLSRSPRWGDPLLRFAQCSKQCTSRVGEDPCLHGGRAPQPSGPVGTRTHSPFTVELLCLVLPGLTSRSRLSSWFPSCHDSRPGSVTPFLGERRGPG